MKKEDLLFVVELIIPIGGVVFGIYAMVVSLPLVPWVFLYIAILGAVIFLDRWRMKISDPPKNTPAKPSKPRNPWIETPKVEKTEKKETKDDIPEIWKDRVLAGGQ